MIIGRLSCQLKIDRRHDRKYNEYQVFSAASVRKWAKFGLDERGGNRHARPTAAPHPDGGLKLPRVCTEFGRELPVAWDRCSAGGPGPPPLCGRWTWPFPSAPRVKVLL